MGVAPQYAPAAPASKSNPLKGLLWGALVGIIILGIFGVGIIFVLPKLISPTNEIAVVETQTETTTEVTQPEMQPLEVTGAADKPISVRSAPAIPAEFQVLLNDDYSDPTSGWKTGEFPDNVTKQRGSVSYQGEALRFVVVDPDWALYSDPGLILTDRTITVDATIPGMMSETDVVYFGAVCWTDPTQESGYQFFITNQGYFGVQQIIGGHWQYFGMENWQVSDAILGTTSEGVTNHLRIDCAGDLLGFYVNEIALIQIPAAVNTGGFSLFAGTYPETEYGADILFDNFRLHGTELSHQEPAAGTRQMRDRDGATQVYVPAGSFNMGSTAEELATTLELCNQILADCKLEWWADEQPVHSVSLDGFWIDQTEVTNGQYQQCVAAQDCSPPFRTHSGMEAEYYGNPAFDNYPVIYITWSQADKYCHWADARLPTEAEWEYAARGPAQTMFPWGNDFNGLNLNYCDANCPVGTPDTSLGDGFREVGAVGSYEHAANWVGAFDMAGNVWEYVADWYAAYPAEARHNPQGPDIGEYRVMRGGAWDTTPDSNRTTNRYAYEIDGWNYAIGFRCASSTSLDTPLTSPEQAETTLPKPPQTDDTPSDPQSFTFYEISRWDAASSDGSEGSAWEMDFSPDGKLLAVGFLRSVMVYRLDPFELLWKEAASDQPVGSISFSPDGSLLASFVYHNVAIRNPLTGEILRLLPIEAPSDLVFSPDGSRLIADTGRGQLQVWNPQTGDLVSTIENPNGMFAIDFFPDGTRFATVNGMGQINIWEFASGSILTTFMEDISIRGLDISPTGELIATPTGSVWRVASEEMIHTFGDPNQSQVAFSPGRNFLAIAGYGKITVWDPGSGENVTTFREELGWINAIAFSPNGKQLAAGTKDGQVLLWQIGE